MSAEIEGAICDECGSRIGPHGCCASIRAQRAEGKRLVLVMAVRWCEHFRKCADVDGALLSERCDCGLSDFLKSCGVTPEDEDRALREMEALAGKLERKS